MGSGAVKRWLRLQLELPQDAADSVSALLYKLDALGLEIVDNETLSFNDLPRTLSPGWTQLVGWFGPSTTHLQQIVLPRVTALLKRRGLVTPAIAISEQLDENWVVAWKKHFTVQTVSPSIEVVPQWLEPSTPPSRVTIRIDPGGAFGTGTHESTRLALIALEQWFASHQVREMLDVGCGSAILSIAAHQLGASRIVAIDSDPGCFDNAARNLQLNNASETVELNPLPLGRLDGEFDLVVANIIAPILLEIAPEIYPRLRPGGTVLLSGILDRQLDAVRDRYQQLGLIEVSSGGLNEWRQIALQRPEG